MEHFDASASPAPLSMVTCPATPDLSDARAEKRCATPYSFHPHHQNWASAPHAPSPQGKNNFLSLIQRLRPTITLPGTELCQFSTGSQMERPDALYCRIG